MLHINYYIKHFRKKKNGKAPIYLRLTYNGERVDMSLRKAVLMEYWDKDQQKAKPECTDANTINTAISDTDRKIKKAYQELMKLGGFDVYEIRDRIKGKNVTQKRGLLSLFGVHNKRFQERVEVGDVAKGSLTKYKTIKKHVAEFINIEYGQKEIGVKRVDPEFIDDFHHFLRTKKKIGHNTTVKYIMGFGRILRIALKKKYIDDDPTQFYEHSVEKVEPGCLDKHQLKAIQNYEPDCSRLEKIKDIFLFSCYTGLAFSDVKQLKKEHITLGVDDRPWIVKKRRKTGNMCRIPLLHIPLNLINKYKHLKKRKGRSGYVFPVISNQQTNTYLRELASNAGIKKHLTFHMGRHTFATTIALANGVPMKTVSEMLGHSSVRMTEHYAKLVSEKISKDMGNLRSRLSKKNEVKVLLEEIDQLNTQQLYQIYYYTKNALKN